MFVDALLGKVGVGEASTVHVRKRSHGLPSHKFFDGICVVVRKKTDSPNSGEVQREQRARFGVQSWLHHSQAV